MQSQNNEPILFLYSDDSLNKVEGGKLPLFARSNQPRSWGLSRPLLEQERGGKMRVLEKQVPCWQRLFSCCFLPSANTGKRVFASWERQRLLHYHFRRAPSRLRAFKVIAVPCRPLTSRPRTYKKIQNALYKTLYTHDKSRLIFLFVF